MASGSNPIRAIFYAFFANLAIAVAKTAAAIYTGSSSMTAEAIHSFADSGNQLLLLVGLKGAQKPSDQEHPLGYGKVTYFWSFIVALLLFSVGGLFSLYEGWHKLHDSGPIENGWVALVVLGFSIVLEAISMRGCLVEVNKIRGNQSLWSWLYRSRNSELVVVFGEDLAALVGLGLALLFVTVALTTGNPVYDAYGSISIGILLVIVALFVASRVANLLIGRSADPDVTAAIARELERSPYILEVFNIITLQVGPQIMLAAKLRMTPGLSLGEAIEHINELERHLRVQVPELGWLFMEPDCQD
ncbi:MAG: cation diffusion facilitator family transporter [Deltaproteobacteria bacterium]|nr:cation diffusion facilitator family transporter [Deltaproteobacteria bacterium]MBW2392858.1 cation diffusion facilitator family transporter [Deltaproteobacteria bacterium]